MVEVSAGGKDFKIVVIGDGNLSFLNKILYSKLYHLFTYQTQS